MQGRLIIIAGLIIMPSLFLRAQTNQPAHFNPAKKITQYIIDSWDNQDGLPSNGLLYITQASDGYIWITSFNGLIRFDGARFTLFNSRKIPFLKNNIFEDLAEDRDGTLWIGTQGSGLVSYKDGVFAAHRPDTGAVPFIKKPFVDRDDVIWFGTQHNGIYRYDRRVFRRYDVLPGQANPTVIGIAQGPDGTMWFSTEGRGVFYLKNDSILPLRQPLPSQIVNAVSVDSKNRLWISTAQGLCRWDGAVLHVLEPTRGYDFFKVVEDNTGCLWAAMTGGLVRVDPGGTHTEFLTPRNGSPIRYAFSMCFDREGSLWVTDYRGGLHRIKDTRLTHFSMHEGFRGKIANAVCALDSATVLVGFDDGLIDMIRDGNIRPFPVRQNLISRRIRHMIKDSKGNIWVGTYGGLLKIEKNGKENWMSRLTGLKDDRIRVVFEDSEGHIWFGTRGEGVFRINDGKIDRQYSLQNGLGSNFIMSIGEDYQRHLWIGTSGGGLSLIRPDGGVETHNEPAGFKGEIVFQIYFDSTGTAWIALNGGIARYKDGGFAYWTQRENFPADSPFDILEDGRGNFWCHTSSGLLRISKASLNAYLDGRSGEVDYHLLTRKDGLREAEGTATSKALKMPDGSLWFPTIQGVVKMDPNTMAINSLIPPVYIEQAVVDNVVTERPQAFEMPYGARRLTLYFTALSLLYPENVMFRYQLEGYDRAWSEPSNARSVQYTSLPPGDYVFRVIAANNDGVWNDKGASLTVTVPTPLWQRWWAWSLYILGLVAFVYGSVHWRTYRLKKRSSELEDKVEARTRELKEAQVQLIHASKMASLGEMVAGIAHEINNPVAFIQGHLDFVKQTIDDCRRANAGDEPCEAMDGMAESVAVSLQGTQRIKSIVEQLRNFSKLHLSSLKDVRLHEEMDTVLDLFFKQHPEIRFEKRFDAALDQLRFACYAEELNLCWYNLLINAVQAIHDAEAAHQVKQGDGQIFITTQLTAPDAIRVTICDNGIGMSREILPKIFDPFFTTRRIGMGRGLGLTEAYGIIQKHRGTIEVHSEPGRGAEFIIILPIINYS